jgi:hypothetical protein
MSWVIRVFSVIVASAVGILAWYVARPAKPKNNCSAPILDQHYVYFPATGNAAGRIYLIPGLDGTTSNFLSTSLYREMMKTLNDDGYEIVLLPPFPSPQPCWFADGGAHYRSLFTQDIRALLVDSDAKYGKLSRNLISGISYGGINAIIGYSSFPGEFVGWQAMLSVTKLTALAELKGSPEPLEFSALSEVDHLKGSYGFLTWGDEDMRVDHREAEKLYDLIKSPHVVGIGYLNLDHSGTPEGTADLIKDARRQLADR